MEQHNSKEIQTSRGYTMVEMIGVLAIIGVLSIGAVFGISYAFDKYKANEILNDLIWRATELKNLEKKNLDEWQSEKTIYPIDLTNEMALRTTGLPKRVCQMVFNELIQKAPVSVNDIKYEVPTYGICSDEENAVVFHFMDFSTPCIPTCAEEEFCVNGICLKNGKPIITKEFDECTPDQQCPDCQSCSNGICIGTGHIDGDSCTTIDGKAGLCVFGECQETGCDKNSDCASNEYCASPNSSGSQKFPTPKSGSCTPLDFVRVQISVNGQQEVYYVSNSTMSWYDADSACSALGKKMPESVSFFVSDWDGTLSKKTLRERAKKLKEAIGSFFVMTTENHSTNTIYSVGLSSGSIPYQTRYFDYDYNIAVCY